MGHMLTLNPNYSMQAPPFWGFLQLQLGIIAACAPTLKPLFSRVLGLSTNKASRLYDFDPSKPTERTNNLTIGGGGTSGRSPRPMQTEFEMDDRMSGTSDDMPSKGQGTAVTGNGNGAYAGAGTFYYAGPGAPTGGRSVSEEMILQGVMTESKSKGGIVRTTQVTVE
jgi:hypothetical protein